MRWSPRVVDPALQGVRVTGSYTTGISQPNDMVGGNSAYERDSRRRRLERVDEILDKLAPHCYSQDRDALDQHNEEWFSVTTRLRGGARWLGQ